MGYLFRRTAAVCFSLLFASTVLAQTQRIRIVAANCTSGNQQSWIEHGSRILDGLNPDVAMLQEFNIGSSASQSATDTDAWVLSTFGAGYVWHREGGGEQIPNGIVSRYPIIASGEIIDSEVSNRDFAWARIDLPGDHDLWAVSMHLLTSGSSVRNTEAGVLVSGLGSLNIPASDYVVFGGDFNTGSRTEGCVNTFRTYLGVSSGQEHTPVDQNNNDDTNAGRNNPYDWVMPDSTLNAFHTSVVIGSSTYTNGLVFDTRVYTPLSEVSPAQSGDSGASNMQHMAIVKDFLIPIANSDYTLDSTSVNFGTVDAASAPFTDSTATIVVTNSFTLNSVSFTGGSASEFSLLTPNLSGGSVAISSNTDLVFRWNPPTNNGATHTATATFAATGTPTSFQIALSGTTQSSGGGGGTPLDAGGYIIDQVNSSLTLTIPAGTTVQPEGFIVIGRNATKSAFESAWGVTLAANVIYINGFDVVASNGFPVINGSEGFSVKNASSVLVDPTSGTLPTGGMSTGNSYFRTATNATTFTSRVQASASPGTYEGTPNHTGKLVITETSDAAAFANEFVELYYDAVATTPVSVDAWGVQ